MKQQPLGPKLVFVNRFFFPDHSATSQLLSDLCFDLAASDLKVHVVTSRQRYEEPFAGMLSEEVVRGVKVHRVWTSTFGRNNLFGRTIDYISFYMSAGLKIFALTRRGDTIVAKTDPPLISVVAAFVARMRAARLVNWIQDVFPEVAVALGINGLQGPLDRALRYLRDLSLRRADVNVALGEGMAEYLAQNGAANVKVIHNWADDETLVPIRPEQNRLRTEWGLASKFVVGYSGNMGRAHEFETILDAALELKSQTDIVFLFIGGGNRMSSIQKGADRRHLGQIMFRHYQAREALAESLSAADVHLISLRPEAERFIVPSKLYGIAAAGRPIVFIGDPQGEIGKIVCSSNCGAALRPGDSSGLARLLLDLRDDADLRREWGANARRLIEEKCSRKRAISLWRNVLTAPV